MKSQVLTITFFLFFFVRSQAQDQVNLADRPGTFEILSRTDYASPECGFIKADITANLERIKDLVAVVRQNPVLNDIKGFMGRARIHTMGMTCKRKEWYGVPARIAFEFCSYFVNKEGRITYNIIEPPSWSLYTNEMIPEWSNIFDMEQSYFTVALNKKTVEPGIDVYDGECWVIYDPKRPPYWVPVTVEEAFAAARKYLMKEKNEIALAYNKKFLEQEFASIPPEDRQKPAYHGGGISRVSASHGYGGKDSIFHRIMKVNPEYLNRSIPRSEIQFMWFRSVQNKQYMKKQLDECVEHRKKDWGSGCDLARFELSFGMTDIRNLSTLIGK